MFNNFFRSKKPYEPLDYGLRKFFENNTLWLGQSYPELSIEERKVFVPTHEDFPITWNGQEQNAIDALRIISESMLIDFNEIEVDFYSEGMTELNIGSSSIFMENDTEHEFTAGLYFGKNERDKYEISINRQNLQNPEILIGTIAHELSHVKLLGKNEEEIEDEHLTDLATVFFGFGIFTANSSFQFYKGNDRWGYSGTGYLTYNEWAYSLALFALLRGEDTPEWSNFLNLTIKKEFYRCLEYMHSNESEIFKFEDDID